MRQRVVLACVVCVLAAAAIFYAVSQSAGVEDVKETRFLLGTIVTFTVSYDGEPDVAQKAINLAVAAMQQVEDMFTTHGDVANSVKDFNHAAAGEQLHLAAEVSQLLQQSLRIGEQTQGSFDPVLGSLNQLWGFSGDSLPVSPPSLKRIQYALQYSGVAHIQDHQHGQWSKDADATALDFGAIAKGLAIDKAMQVLKKNGIRHAIINAGGDLRIVGDHAGKPWNIAVRHPRTSQPLGWLEVSSEMSIVTSGDYERFYMQQGKRYHHILDPKTGMPATASMGVTVIAKQAAQADALSTAMFVLGATLGLPIVEGMSDVEAIWVDRFGKVYMSSGMKGLFHLRGEGE